MKCRACGFSFQGGPQRIVSHNIGEEHSIRTCNPSNVMQGNEVDEEATQERRRIMERSKALAEQRWAIMKEKARKKREQADTEAAISRTRAERGVAVGRAFVQFVIRDQRDVDGEEHQCLLRALQVLLARETHPREYRCAES